MTKGEIDAFIAHIEHNLSEPSVQDLLDSVSVVAAKRRRPKVSRRNRLTMRTIEAVEVDKALKHAVRESRAGLNQCKAYRLAEANQARAITEIAVAAAKELAQTEPLPQALLDDIDDGVRAQVEAVAHCDVADGIMEALADGSRYWSGLGEVLSRLSPDYGRRGRRPK